MTFITRLHSEDERLMISQNVKRTSLAKIAEMFGSQIHGQKFPTEGTVPGLHRLEFFLEKKARGTHISFWYCCRTPPTANSEASTCSRVGADYCGKTRRVTLASADLV